MREKHRSGTWRCVLLFLLVAGVTAGAPAQEAAPATAHLVGTVTSLNDIALTLTPDKGEPTTMTLLPETEVFDLPPGSTDLKAAHLGDLHEIEIGDRVLITSSPGAGAAPAVVRRVVVMKSTAIAQQRASEQAGWAHSRGGTVETVDAASGGMTMASRGRTITVTTTPNTIFRRYAADSVRFEDSKRSSIATLRIGDQARVRGEITGEAVQAAEIVSGTFEQISGNVAAMDQAASTVILRDLRTKTTVVVKVTPKTEIHDLPQQMAARFAERSKSAGKGSSHQVAGVTDAGATKQQSEGDLGQEVARLPDLALSDVKVGRSVLLVATGDPSAPTAITVLVGVEPILAAMENGGAETSLAPWSMSGGDSAGGASQ